MKKKFVLSTSLMAIIVYNGENDGEGGINWVPGGIAPFTDRAIFTASDRSGSRLTIQGTTLLVSPNDLYQPDENRQELIQNPTAKDIFNGIFDVIVSAAGRSVGERTVKVEEKTPVVEKGKKTTPKKEETPAPKKEETPEKGEDGIEVNA